jgi:peptidyl-prolyl cis-trans isomerase SurA
MQYNIKPLKNISIVPVLTIALLCFYALTASAQMNKIDGVEVVVGKNIVLNSDIAKFKLDLEERSEGQIKITDCEMLEQLMLQKLLSHHAVIDSVLVSEAEVNSSVERNIAFFTQQFGTIEDVVKKYGFNDIEDLKAELFAIEKENSMVQKEQQKINAGVDVTPEEVRLYFKSLKDKNELPEFQAEIELAQIVLYAAPAAAENERILTKLSQLKKQIEAGSNFKMKAILNSDDPAVSQNGGQYEITQESPFIKEFKEVAFSLDVNEISAPFKSQFGYHIIQLHQVKGKTRVASHILIQPEIEDTKLKEAQEEITKIRKDILENNITFVEAVSKFSQDKDTKNNGGLIVNASTNETRFDLTRMDPTLYARVSDLQKGEITEPFYDETREGEKMYKIILMKDRTNTHIADMVNDYVKVQRLALQKKKEENITKWAKEKITDTYIKVSDAYATCTFEKNWRKEK